MMMRLWVPVVMVIPHSPGFNEPCDPKLLHRKRKPLCVAAPLQNCLGRQLQRRIAFSLQPTDYYTGDTLGVSIMAGLASYN